MSDYEKNLIGNEIFWAAIKSIADYSVNEYKVPMEQDERCRKVSNREIYIVAQLGASW